MSIHKKLFVLAATFPILSPAAAAQCTTDTIDSIRNDQVKLAVIPTQVMLARGRINDVAVTPFMATPNQPKKIIQERATFSVEGSAMRWLYSTIADKRVFAIYSSPQRGRPAELRITARLSVL